VRRHVARHHRQGRHLRALADRDPALNRRAGADPGSGPDDDRRADDALQADRHLDVVVAMVEVDDDGLVAEHGSLADLDAGVCGERAPFA
jgi:hypothetical protein